MKKILLTIFLFCSLRINGMEIKYPAPKELRTIDNVVEDCTCYITQLITSNAVAARSHSKNPCKAIQFDHSKILDAQLCLLLHQNAGFEWDIYLEDHNDRATNKVRHIMYLKGTLNQPILSQANSCNYQGVYNYLLKKYQHIIVNRLRKNWKLEEKDGYIALIKRSNYCLKDEDKLIVTLLEKLNLNDSEKIEVRNYEDTSGQKLPTFIEIKSPYIPTFEHLFNFSIEKKEVIDLTTSKK